jgi:hypothetical protein
LLEGLAVRVRKPPAVIVHRGDQGYRYVRP